MYLLKICAISQEIDFFKHESQIHIYLMKFLDLDSVFITFLKRNVVACVIMKEKELKIIVGF